MVGGGGGSLKLLLLSVKKTSLNSKLKSVVYVFICFLGHVKVFGYITRDCVMSLDLENSLAN